MQHKHRNANPEHKHMTKPEQTQMRKQRKTENTKHSKPKTNTNTKRRIISIATVIISAIMCCRVTKQQQVYVNETIRIHALSH